MQREDKVTFILIYLKYILKDIFFLFLKNETFIMVYFFFSPLKMIFCYQSLIEYSENPTIFTNVFLTYRNPHNRGNQGEKKIMLGNKSFSKIAFV